MKKIVSFLIVLLLLPSVLAITTEIKQTYQPGETLITPILGNILNNIEKGDVELKRGHVQVPFDYDIKKLGDNYYLYAILPKFENNYTLVIKDLVTTVNGKPETIDFEQNFTTSGELVPYYIKPGFTLTNKDFDLTITSNIDLDEVISSDFPEEHEITISPGENKLSFSQELFEQGLTIINLGIYSVPIWIIKDATPNFPNSDPFRFFPLKIESTILVDSSQTYPFKIVNLGEKTLEEITLIYNDTLFTISPSTIGPLSPKEEIELELSLNNYTTNISDTIIAKSGDMEIELPINVIFTEEETEVSTPYLEDNFSQAQSFYCSELSGTFCQASQVCDGESVQAIDGNSCCVGSCTSPNSKQSFAWIGWLIGSILVLILIIIFVKYKKSKKQEHPLSKKLKKS